MTPDRRAERGWMTGVFVVAFFLGIGYVIWLSVGASGGVPDQNRADIGPSAQVQATRTARPTRAPRPTRTPRPTPAPSPALAGRKVGIVAGHWQNDPGAVCPDGLREVDINLDVAIRVVAILQANGIDAELLPEFAEELAGYRADAFVSIHTDSCEFPDLSGFKVARVASSAIPEQEDQLVRCLIRDYEEATGLVFDEDTITFDMTDYHAFWEIGPATPGAIIEVGFMGADRQLLTGRSDEVASGIARGILRFLSGE